MDPKLKKTLVALVSIVVILMMFPLFAFAQDDGIQNTAKELVTIPFSIPGSEAFNTASIVWIVFLLIVVVFIAYSLILLYHWFRYTFSSLAMWPVLFIYFGVSFVLISTMFFAALSIT